MNYCTMLALGNYGRFANGAYQVAGVIGVARRNGLSPVFPLWQNKWHRDAFGSQEDIDIYKHLVNPLPLIPDDLTWQERSVGWGYHDVDLPEGNWNLSGHFQSTKYFEHCLDEVKWYLTMKDEPPQNDLCAIHVRLGDYDNAYHPRLGTEYYREAVGRFDKDQKFLVFSDDMDAVRYMFNESDKFQFSRGKDYLEDWKLMKKCRHFIIGNSSFSALAAVLGEAKDKRVIAPRPWFGPSYTDITGEDIYNPDWEIVDYQKAA